MRLGAIKLVVELVEGGGDGRRKIWISVRGFALRVGAITVFAIRTLTIRIVGIAAAIIGATAFAVLFRLLEIPAPLFLQLNCFFISCSMAFSSRSASRSASALAHHALDVCDFEYAQMLQRSLGIDEVGEEFSRTWRMSERLRLTKLCKWIQVSSLFDWSP